MVAWSTFPFLMLLRLARATVPRIAMMAITTSSSMSVNPFVILALDKEAISGLQSAVLRTTRPVPLLDGLKVHVLAATL